MGVLSVGLMFGTEQLQEGVQTTFPLVQLGVPGLRIVDRPDWIFRYAVLSFLYSLHDDFDLRGAVVWHGDQIKVFLDTLCTLNTRRPAFQTPFVISVETEGRLLAQDRAQRSVRPGDALARIVIGVDAESREKLIDLFFS